MELYEEDSVIATIDRIRKPTEQLKTHANNIHQKKGKKTKKGVIQPKHQKLTTKRLANKNKPRSPSTQMHTPKKGNRKTRKKNNKEKSSMKARTEEEENRWQIKLAIKHKKIKLELTERSHNPKCLLFCFCFLPLLFFYFLLLQSEMICPSSFYSPASLSLFFLGLPKCQWLQVYEFWLVFACDSLQLMQWEILKP